MFKVFAVMDVLSPTDTRGSRTNLTPDTFIIFDWCLRVALFRCSGRSSKNEVDLREQNVSYPKVCLSHGNERSPSGSLCFCLSLSFLQQMYCFAVLTFSSLSLLPFSPTHSCFSSFGVRNKRVGASFHFHCALR